MKGDWFDRYIERGDQLRRVQYNIDAAQSKMTLMTLSYLQITKEILRGALLLKNVLLNGFYPFPFFQLILIPQG